MITVTCKFSKLFSFLYNYSLQHENFKTCIDQVFNFCLRSVFVKDKHSIFILSCVVSRAHLYYSSIYAKLW